MSASFRFFRTDLELTEIQRNYTHDMFLASQPLVNAVARAAPVIVIGPRERSFQAKYSAADIALFRLANMHRQNMHNSYVKRYPNIFEAHEIPFGFEEMQK